MHRLLGGSMSTRDYDIDDHARETDIVEYRPQLPRRPGAPALVCLYLKGTDSIGLIGFPSTCIDLVRSLINKHWEDDGVRREIQEPGGHIFKIRGWPWVAQRSDAVRVRRLLRSILVEMRNVGWLVHLTTNISTAATGKDAIVFRRSTVAHDPPGSRQWFSIVFSMQSRLRLIDAPEDLIGALIPILPHMIEHEKNPRDQGVHDFELKGKPFHEGYLYDGPSPAAPNLVLFLVQFLEDNGCSIYASIKQKQSNGEADGAPDTWHICRKLN